MSTSGYLGIDAGTQGLSVIFADNQLNVIARGEADYAMVTGLETGCYEQRVEDWESALRQAMLAMRDSLPGQHANIDVQCIGISGQMHGEVLANETGESLGPARLWCDSRNAAEEEELTKSLDTKMPKRITAARWLWTCRNLPDKAGNAAHLTTPAGWLSHRLTGEWVLGIGDASGMFPIDQETLNYDQKLLEKFDHLVPSDRVARLVDLLPKVRNAGQDGGRLNTNGASLLGLPTGIPVAPAEGDQPAALAGSLIGQPGIVSVSFGTSVCANSVGDRSFRGFHPAIDHFCAADGKPINMVWLRNGTTFMNRLVETLTEDRASANNNAFESIMPQVLKAEPDCGGLLAIPFMDDEPGLGVARGNTASILGLNTANATAGNIVKAALLSTIFNLRLGCRVLDQQGFPRKELVLTGGLTKTPELSQLLADVLSTPVTLLPDADEGTAWGAALLAKYRYLSSLNQASDWQSFLAEHATETRRKFQPNSTNAEKYEVVFGKYKKLVENYSALDECLKPD